MNHFDPDLDPESMKAREQFIEHREKQLQSITMSAAEAGIKYLFAINAGGAIAVLTYMGAIATNQNQQKQLSASLVLFFIGVVFVGLYHTFVAESYGLIFRKFQASTKSYFVDKRNWEDFMTEIQQQVKPSNIPRIFVYSSFIFFILGCLLGAANLFKWPV